MSIPFNGLIFSLVLSQMAVRKKMQAKKKMEVKVVQAVTKTRKKRKKPNLCHRENWYERLTQFYSNSRFHHVSTCYPFHLTVFLH